MKRNHSFSDFPEDSFDPEFGPRPKHSSKPKQKRLRPQREDPYGLGDDDFESDIGSQTRDAKWRHFQDLD